MPRGNPLTQVWARVSQEEAEILKRLAAVRGVKVAEVVREFIKSGLEQVPKRRLYGQETICEALGLGAQAKSQIHDKVRKHQLNPERVIEGMKIRPFGSGLRNRRVVAKGFTARAVAVAFCCPIEKAEEWLEGAAATITEHDDDDEQWGLAACRQRMLDESGPA